MQATQNSNRFDRLAKGTSVVFDNPGAVDGLRERTYLGTDRYGNRYWLDITDRYVYQMLATGYWNGWFCAQPVWETTMHRIVTRRAA